ncbi:MAG: LysM peptidoglycan-binding domain-containing protein [Oscillospiraceae bacterium]|nr:LysM peptidoglycan-binding domain-containing protein [Oscillospiraceae bacterium]
MKTNRLLSLLLCLCMVITLFTGFAETASAEDYVTYTVQTGDNLYTLVGKMGMNYGTVKYVIMALNGFTNEAQLSQLQPGQTIILPTSNQAAASLATKANAAATTAVTTTAAAAATTATTATTTTSTAASTYQGYTPAYYLVQHKVQQGETLISICKALGTNYYDYSSVILKLNNLDSANSLTVGQTLWVPAKVGSAGGTIAVIAYSVKNGDTISGICAKYDTSYANYKDAVKAVNAKVANVEKLSVGQTVYIPVYTSYNNAVAGNPSTAAGTSGSPTTNIATGYAIGFTVPESAKYGNPFAIVGGQSNVTRAPAGTTVVVRPNAYDGYAVKSIKVVRTDSNAHVQLNDYAFTMPSSNVQISIEYAAGKKIQKMPSSHGTFDTMVYGEMSTTGFYGDKVEIVPYPDYGYEIKEVTVKDSNGKDITVTQNRDTGVFAFTMPNLDIRVTVTFQPANSIRLYANFGTYRGNGTVLFYKGDAQVTEASRGDTIRVVIVPADGWIIDPATTEEGGKIIPNPNFNVEGSTKYPPVDGKKSFIAKTAQNEAEIVKVNEYVYDIKIPATGTAGPVYVDVNFKQKIPYALAKENLSGTPMYGTVTFTVTDPVTGEIRKNADYAFEGDIVEIVPYAGTKGEYGRGYVSYKYDPDGVVAGSGTDQHTTLWPSGGMLPDANWEVRGYKFRMPASSVNVEPRFYDDGTDPYTIASTDAVEIDIAVMDNEHGTIEVLDSTGKNKIHKAIPGDTVIIQVTADKGYRVQREAYGSPVKTLYGIYVNFCDNGPTLTRLDGTGSSISSSGISPGSIKFLDEKTNETGNAVLRFELDTPFTTDGTNLFGLPVQLTAFYEPFNSSYKDGSDVNVTRNKVQLTTANVNDGTTYGTFYGNESPALAVTAYGRSGSSNVQMFVNGAVAPDGTTVQVGTTVGFVFTVKEGYRLDSVWKTRKQGGGYDNQMLTSVDGIYYYTVTQKDAEAIAGASGEPIIEFEVRTEKIEAKKHYVYYSLVNAPGSANYTIAVNTGSGASANQEAKAGDVITLTIDKPAAIGSSGDPVYSLARVMVGGSNLSNGDLTEAGEKWVYTFVMPDADVTTEVAYKEAVLLDLN